MSRPTLMRYATGLPLCLGLLGAACQPQTTQTETPPPRMNSQVQVARQFLLEVLAQNFSRAYPLLAPDMRGKVSLTEFERQAQPFVALGTRRGTDLELYKLGARLPAAAGQQTEFFVAFAWAADSASAHRLPAEWLEVTFPDTVARQVMGFRLRAPRTGK